VLSEEDASEPARPVLIGRTSAGSGAVALVAAAREIERRLAALPDAPPENRYVVTAIGFVGQPKRYAIATGANERYLRSGNRRQRLLGGGPVLLDLETGDLHAAASAFSIKNVAAALRAYGSVRAVQEAYRKERKAREAEAGDDGVPCAEAEGARDPSPSSANPICQSTTILRGG
jgi:hypothetical protein